MSRLSEIGKLVQGPVLADIGSDHGQLLVNLLETGGIEFGIAVENHRLPFENSVRALSGMNADVRFGDGLEPLEAGEASCLSICGMGARSIRQILEAFPDRVPSNVVLQPNNHPEAVRRWAWNNHYHLVAERTVKRDWAFNILSFQRSAIPDVLDPAYAGIDVEAGLLFGPLEIQQGSPEFVQRLVEEQEYWSQFERLEVSKANRLRLIHRTLEHLELASKAKPPSVHEATKNSPEIIAAKTAVELTERTQRVSRAVKLKTPSSELSGSYSKRSPADIRFKFFTQLNQLSDKRWLGSPVKFSQKIAERHFHSNRLQDAFLNAIAVKRILSIKEVMESFEVFERVRKSVRSGFVADLCCGHGLLGILFAMFERKVGRVLLMDKKEPESRQKLIDAAIDVAPWVAQKIEARNARISVEDDWIESGCSVVSAHACGVLSDLCIDIAIKSGGPLAILPCCYPKVACRAPLALQTAFGLEAAFDIDRTYRLEAAGYCVRWSQVPAEITPMNRVLIARKSSRPTRRSRPRTILEREVERTVRRDQQ